MVKNLAKLSLLVSVLLIAACSKSEPEAVSEQPTAEPPPTAEPSPETATEEGGSGDPTVLDPDHYMTEFENDAVRIVRIQAQMTLPDGSTADIAASAGEAVFNSAGEHLPKNSSDSAWEVVEVELKPRDSAGAASDGPDATVVDADHYTTEFENESVRIVRIAYGAGEASVMHYHPDSVAVFVTDHLVQMTMPDGSTEEIAAAAGDAIFIPGGQHLPKNVADSGWELVLIELK
jgi:quercetin dioxygenase-like cupin family protein